MVAWASEGAAKANRLCLPATCTRRPPLIGSEVMSKRAGRSPRETATPIAGDFDFKDLARRFPLSGGYIRNSTLRGAFLAAQENRPLAQEHLLRAIALEYREMGKLATSGRME